MKSATGSEPGDNTKINGVFCDVSLKHLSKSKVGATIYCFPILFIIQLVTASITFLFYIFFIIFFFF